MIETIFYYTGGLFLILTLSILVIILMWGCLLLIDMINKKTKTFTIFYYELNKMNLEERQLINDVYKSIFENGKEELKQKYFKD